MNLFKRLFTRTKRLSSDTPPDVTQPPPSVPEAANALTSPEDGARITRPAMLAREELIAPPAPPADKYADDDGDDDGEDPMTQTRRRKTHAWFRRNPQDRLADSRRVTRRALRG